MQNRKDRIHFPAVVPEELWGSVAMREAMYGDQPPELTEFGTPPRGSCKTPKLLTPEESLRNDGGEYFRLRERMGLVTPPRTPSDILRRGPLFESEDSDSSRDLNYSPS